MISRPRTHATPPDALGETTRETIVISGVTIEYWKPASLDKLFDHPAVRAAYAADEYIPYWADVWPVSRMLAEVVLDEPWQNHHEIEALEIGCGLGITGIAALIRGLNVTFSDVDRTAVELAGRNAELNGFQHYHIDTIDIRAPHDREYDLILGADVMYEARMTEPLVDFLRESLAPGGLALIADPGRYAAAPFESLLARNGFQATKTDKILIDGENTSTAYLYRITHR